METELRSKEWRTQAKKALVTLAIEKNLTEKFGRPLLETVSKKLFDMYKCYIPDCYENPERLHRVLEDLFGDSYLVMAKSIWDEVGYCLLILPKFSDEEFIFQGRQVDSEHPFDSNFIHNRMDAVDSAGSKKTNETMTMMASEMIKRLNLNTFVN
jgi:hypothetical protein